MLIGLDHRLTPDLLYALAAMGHGDEIVVADANYPCTAHARDMVITSPIQLSGLTTADAIDIITSIMPLDGFTDYAALRMQVDGKPDEMTLAHTAAFDIMRPRLPEGGTLSSIERQAFYAKARTAFAIVHTSEFLPFGCFILRKGVVFSV